MGKSMTAPGVATVGNADPKLAAMLQSNTFVGLSENTSGPLGASCAAIVLVDATNVVFCERFGFTESLTPRDAKLWDRAIAADGPFMIEDADADPDFADTGLVVGGVPARFFACCVFRAADGEPIGAYCVADPAPQTLKDIQLKMLYDLARWIESEVAKFQDLDKVAEVQHALLPKTVPPLPGYQVAGVCLPAKAAGGDFYDWYPIEGGLGFTLADVMGKGVAAAILAATVRATVRSARKKDVLEAVERADEALAQDLGETASFVTLFHARLDAATGKISFVDAGHGLTILMAADGSYKRIGGGDLPLGIPLSDAPRSRHRMTLEEGGTLVTFSDGVLDLYDGSLASIDGVAEVVRGASSAQDVVDEFERLARESDMSDDITVLAIRRTGGSA